jgi:gliding motility-associated-like protein
MAVPSTTTTYTITVTDLCGNQVSEDIVYTILSPPLVLEMSPSVEICPGDSTEIFVNPSGGFGDYFYEWFHSGETTQSVWVNPEVTTNYTVSVSDECQTFTVEGSVQIVVVEPTANFEIIGPVLFNDLPITFQNSSQNAISYEWTFGDGQNSTLVHPNNTYDEPGTYYVTLIATDDKGCKDTIQKPISIEEEWYIYIPNTFTPDGDRFNNTFQVSVVGIEVLSVQIFNRWGQLIFEDDDPRFKWDGTYRGRYVNDGTYTYKINYTTNSGRTESLVGHVNVLK